MTYNVKKKTLFHVYELARGLREELSDHEDVDIDEAPPTLENPWLVTMTPKTAYKDALTAEMEELTAAVEEAKSSEPAAEPPSQQTQTAH
jgi:hypothetical protein